MPRRISQRSPPGTVHRVLHRASHRIPAWTSSCVHAPTRSWVLPRVFGGTKITFNPGAFNVKEHVLIYMMANIAISAAYVMNAIVSQSRSTVRPWVCDPARLRHQADRLWPREYSPQNPAACTLLNTLHEENKPGWKRDGVGIGSLCTP